MKNVNSKDIQRSWRLIDAKNKILGRLASEIAVILMGKNKSYYTPYLDTGDNVVVINAKDIVLTGKKENQKKYYHHSQYPGGLYKKSTQDLRVQKPQELIKHAVSGMLPKTKLGKMMAKKLYIYPESEHPYKDKFATTESTVKKHEDTEKSGGHPRGEVKASPGRHPGGESGSETQSKSVSSVVASK